MHRPNSCANNLLLFSTGDITISQSELDNITVAKIPRALSDSRLNDFIPKKLQQFFSSVNRTQVCIEKNVGFICFSVYF